MVPLIRIVSRRLTAQLLITPKDAVNLNNLDDWKEFHDAVLK